MLIVSCCGVALPIATGLWLAPRNGSLMLATAPQARMESSRERIAKQRRMPFPAWEAAAAFAGRFAGTLASRA